MSNFVKVSSNVTAFIASLALDAQAMRDATRIALNKTAEQMKTALAREIAQAGYKMKSSAIKKGIRIVRASDGSLSAHVIASGRPIPLVEFNARATAKGVSVSVLKGRKIIKGAFIATMPNGKRIVAIREPNARHRKVNKGDKPRWSALPIRQLYGPSIPDAAINPAVVKAVYDKYTEKFPQLLDHEYRRLLNKIKRPSKALVDL